MYMVALFALLKHYRPSTGKWLNHSMEYSGALSNEKCLKRVDSMVC